MRDLEEYPITKAEIIRALKDLAADAACEGRTGEFRAAILREAAKHIQDYLPSGKPLDDGELPRVSTASHYS